MMGTVRKLSEFFRNSPKRQNHLVVKIKELLTDSNHRILIDFCRTRWAAKRRPEWTFLRLRRKLPLYRMPLETFRQTLRVIIIDCLKRQYNFHWNLVFNLADQELSSAKLFLVSILYQLQKHTIGSTLRKCFWTIACSNFNLDFIQKPRCVLKVFLMYHLFFWKLHQPGKLRF